MDKKKKTTDLDFYYLSLVSSVPSLVMVMFANGESCGRAGSSVALPNLEKHREELK